MPFNDVPVKKNYFPPLFGTSGGIYVTDQFSLNIKVRSFVSGIIVGVKIYLLQKDGKPQMIKLDNLQPTADGSEYVRTFALAEGLLLDGDVSVLSTSVLCREGDCYVSINLQGERENVANSSLFVNLASGYITNTKGISFPSAGIQAMTDVPGKSVIIPVTTPAAGANFTYTIPDHRRFCLNLITFELVATGAANRNAIVQIQEYNGSNGAFFFSTTNVTAGQTGFYTFGNFGATERALVVGSQHFLDVPMSQGLELHAGDIINSVVSGLQGADTILRVRLYGKLWVDVGTAAGSPGGGGGAT